MYDMHVPVLILPPSGKEDSAIRYHVLKAEPRHSGS